MFAQLSLTVIAALCFASCTTFAAPTDDITLSTHAYKRDLAIVQCDRTQREKLQTSLGFREGDLSRLSKYLSTPKASRNDPSLPPVSKAHFAIFKYWFGPDTDLTWKEVTGKVQGILNKINWDALSYTCEAQCPDHSTATQGLNALALRQGAYVQSNKPTEVHLCSNVWASSPEGLLGAIIDALFLDVASHWDQHSGDNQPPQILTEKQSHDLAQTNPAAAVQSAFNYVYFIRSHLAPWKYSQLISGDDRSMRIPFVMMINIVENAHDAE